MPGAEVFDQYADRYGSWFERHPVLYDAELRALKALLPESACGIEIGVGSGRFAHPLGIRYGVDPSPVMLELAKVSGIQAVCGRAEALPFKAVRFDLVLLVTTLCFIDDPEVGLKEACRVLLPGGTILMGTIDADCPPGVNFIRGNRASPFFKEARFHSVDYVAVLMRQAGFAQFEFRQTLGQGAALTDRVEPVEEGHGRGLFAVIKARKS